MTRLTDQLLGPDQDEVGTQRDNDFMKQFNSVQKSERSEVPDTENLVHMMVLPETTSAVRARRVLRRFSVAFMYTPMHDELDTSVGPPPELKVGPDIVESTARLPRWSASIPIIVWVDLEAFEFRTPSLFAKQSSGPVGVWTQRHGFEFRGL